MIFTECNENNEIVFNEKTNYNKTMPDLKDVKNIYIDICNKVIPYIKSHKKDGVTIDYPGCDMDAWPSSPSKEADMALQLDYVQTKRSFLKNHKYSNKSICICQFYHSKDTTQLNNIVNIANKCIPEKYKNDMYIAVFGGEDSKRICLNTYALQVESCIRNYNESEVLAFSGNTGGSYMHDALYESYIQAKINAEDRLAFALKESMIISESDYSNIRVLQEAKLSDKIKAKWKKFVAFIKGLFAKFMESMTNLLLDEKDYLEKYKDIILKKKPKDSMEYSYTGDYAKGINRLINTEIPLFDYEKYRKQLESEDDSDLVIAIMQGKNFNYDDGETLAEQFKSYFLALEEGQQEGKFSSLNMADIYNFCYNFNKIKGIVDKDINRLDASTRAIESAINKVLNSTVSTTSKTDNAENSTSNTTSTTPKTDNAENSTSNTATNNTANNESVIFTEAEEEKANNTGLEIKNKPSSDPTSKMSSTQNRDKNAEDNVASTGSNAAKDNNKKAADITKAADKWIAVCRPIIGAKLTACQQIAKDYMEIIRAHVRSYGGQDKKSKEGNKSPDIATKYSKDAENAKKEAEKPT